MILKEQLDSYLFYQFIIAKASLFGVHFEMLLPIAQEEFYKKTGSL